VSYRPSSAVLGRAGDEGVPVVVVDRTEHVLCSGRTHRPETVERMATPLDESVDGDALLSLR